MILKNEIQEIVDEQKLINNVCLQESGQIKKLRDMISENQLIVRQLNKTMVREIALYKNVNQLMASSQVQTCMRILCLMFDTELWDVKNERLYKDPEAVLQQSKKIMTSTQVPLQKRLMQFECESMSYDKVQFIRDLIDENKLTVEGVGKSSIAMSFIAKWEFGMLN